ncbi:MAG: hypothetical protein C0614_12730 [Desulfuromonas sp.]|nr:MAG: hypothetical protein C0614_12730 [Desulfuromonas sp.]
MLLQAMGGRVVVSLADKDHSGVAGIGEHLLRGDVRSGRQVQDVPHVWWSRRWVGGFGVADGILVHGAGSKEKGECQTK